MYIKALCIIIYLHDVEVGISDPFRAPVNSGHYFQSSVIPNRAHLSLTPLPNVLFPFLACLLYKRLVALFIGCLCLQVVSLAAKTEQKRGVLNHTFPATQLSIKVQRSL